MALEKRGAQPRALGSVIPVLLQVEPAALGQNHPSGASGLLGFGGIETTH